MSCKIAKYSSSKDFTQIMAFISANYYLKLILMCLVVCFCVSACGNDKQVSFKSGGMMHTFAEGKDALPKDFPLPIYPGATTTGSVSAEGNNKEQSRFLMLSSQDSLEKISEFYQSELKNKSWEIENVQTWPKLVSISAKQKNEEANIMLADDNGKTTISLSAGRTTEDNNDKPDEIDLENFKPEKTTPPTD